MNTILITGGAGFIGSTLVRELIARSDTQVVILDKLTYAGNLNSLQPVTENERCHFYQGDILDHALVRRLLDQFKPSAVMHLAAESHVDRSIDEAKEFVLTNVVGTTTLLDAALHYWQALDADDKAAFRFLHVSTDEVYGSLGKDGAFTERCRYQPNSPYSASKAASDHFVRAHHQTFGLPTIVTNCSNNYGPYQFPEKLIPLTILNAIEGKPLPVYGDGTNVRDWIHVVDHCHALLTVLNSGRVGETYNIGGNCERSNLDVVKTIRQIVDDELPATNQLRASSEIVHVSDRPGHDQRYAVDTTKIREQLNWSPRYEFSLGLRETVRWYLKNQQWCQQIESGAYRRERLGTRT